MTTATETTGATGAPRPSLMALGAAQRLVLAIGLAALLWAAVWWAVG